MNARNNYQIMHVELVFLHPEPLKGKAKNIAMRAYEANNPTALVTGGGGPALVGGLRAGVRQGDGAQGPGLESGLLGLRLR